MLKYKETSYVFLTFGSTDIEIESNLELKRLIKPIIDTNVIVNEASLGVQNLIEKLSKINNV